jgi:protein arginine kinase
MGQSEQEIIKNLKNVVSFIKEKETKLREECISKDKTDVEDNIYRSLGIIENARKISGSEAMRHLSNIREGYILGFSDMPHINETIYSIMINVQPGNIGMVDGKAVDVNKRDQIRADYLRSIFKK